MIIVSYNYNSINKQFQGEGNGDDEMRIFRKSAFFSTTPKAFLRFPQMKEIAYGFVFLQGILACT